MHDIFYTKFICLRKFKRRETNIQTVRTLTLKYLLERFGKASYQFFIPNLERYYFFAKDQVPEEVEKKLLVFTFNHNNFTMVFNLLVVFDQVLRNSYRLQLFIFIRLVTKFNRQFYSNVNQPWKGFSSGCCCLRCVR